MGQFRFRKLEKFQVGRDGENLLLSLPFGRTPRGLVYRSCPNQACSPGLFLLGDSPEDQTIGAVNAPLVRRRPKNPGTTCPYCGTDADDGEFLFQGDINAATEHVAWAVQQDVADFIGDALADMARGINRSGSKCISADYTPGSKEPEPVVWREDLLRNLTCTTCERHYGVYAIALFCPDCGSRNLGVHFQREVELVQKQIDVARSIDDKELSYRLLGNAHEDVLTALETYLKTAFRFIVRNRLPTRYVEICSAIKSDFQNIDRGRRQFALLSFDPYAALSEGELSALRLNIEKRHIVVHNLGLADERYQRTSQDEQAGQTIRILADDISSFAAICAKVVATIEGLPDFLPPSLSTTNGPVENDS
jgi:hypothetical protein